MQKTAGLKSGELSLLKRPFFDIYSTYMYLFKSTFFFTGIPHM